MLLLVVAVVAGLAAGVVRRPLGARSVRVRIQRLPLLVVGAGGTALSRLVSTDLATMVMGVSLAVLLAFAIANVHVTGVVVIGFGLLLNLTALVLNDGIPVRGEALVRAGVVERADLLTTRFAPPRHLETPADRLAVLGDVVPVPIAQSVLSFGDLVVIVGTADAMRELARRRRRSWSQGERVDYDSTMTQLKAVHDWGTAPSAAPESGSQYSANLDLRVPVTIDLTSDEPTASPTASTDDGEAAVAAADRSLETATHNK